MTNPRWLQQIADYLELHPELSPLFGDRGEVIGFASRVCSWDSSLLLGLPESEEEEP